MKLFDAAAKPSRVVPDLVETHEPVVSVKRGVLDCLGLDGARELLKPRSVRPCLGADQSISKWSANADLGPFSSTSSHQGFSPLAIPV